MTDDRLCELSNEEIDALPFGYMALDNSGTVLRYNRWEAELARLDAKSQIGKNFFREVAPCTQVQEFEGAFRVFATSRPVPEPISFDFAFKFRHGLQQVRIGFIRSGLTAAVIVTINRQRDIASSDVRVA